MFFNKIKNIFGGEINLLLYGGAVLQKEILQGLKIMLGCPLVQGYGQTENSGTVLLSSMYDICSGSIGGIQNTTELKLINLPEFNYFSNDVNPIKLKNQEVNYVFVVILYLKVILKILQKQKNFLMKMVGFILMMLELF